MSPSENSIFEDFYQLCEVMDDDVNDVAIVVSHVMWTEGITFPLTSVRRDLMDPTVENIQKYAPFISDCLDIPIKDLRNICDKKLAVTNQLRVKIKELQEELKHYKEIRVVKRVSTKTVTTTHTIESLFGLEN